MSLRQLQLHRKAIDADAVENRPETHDRDSTTREARHETGALIPLSQVPKDPNPAFPVVLYDALALTTPRHEPRWIDVTLSDIEGAWKIPACTGRMKGITLTLIVVRLLGERKAAFP